jgi:hypothetical protein
MVVAALLLCYSWTVSTGVQIRCADAQEYHLKSLKRPQRFSSHIISYTNTSTPSRYVMHAHAQTVNINNPVRTTDAAGFRV